MPTTVRAALRAALTDAMRARDPVATAALRSAVAAIDNAEAVDPDAAPVATATSADVAGGVAGLGAAEVARRTLDEAEVLRVVRAEVDERQVAAADYERLGRADHAARLRAEAAAIATHLP